MIKSVDNKKYFSKKDDHKKDMSEKDRTGDKNEKNSILPVDDNEDFN